MDELLSKQKEEEEEKRREGDEKRREEEDEKRRKGEEDKRKEVVDETKSDEIVPPDGGIWAWMVLVSCFLVNGIIFGVINTFGILFVKLKADLEKAGVEDAALKCSLVGSLTIGSTFLLSFLVGIVSDRIGLRVTALLGGAIATLGMGLSSLHFHSVEVLYVSYGILFGAGSSMVYTPSLTILGHYFRKHLGVVNGVVTAGSSVFTIVLSFTNTYILEHYGVQACLQMFTVLTSVTILASLTFVPVLPPPAVVHTKHQSKFGELVQKVIYLPNWKNKRYVIWALAIPTALFGYFVPYVHLVEFAKNIPLDENEHMNGEKASTLVACIGITSGLGRLIFGKLSDHSRIKVNGNRIILQQIAFVAIGVCTMLLTLAPYFGDYAYESLMGFCCLMGLFDGCFITMIGPIAYDICGPNGAGQGIGFLLGMLGLPLTIGPPIAGFIYDHVGDYTGAFIGAGIPPIFGAACMLLIRRYPQNKEPVLEKENAETKQSLLS